MLAGDKSAISELTEQRDIDAATWGVEELMRLADGAKVETDETKLKVITLGMTHEGTEDARASRICTSFDFKTGQVYDYEAQAAAYSYGNMEREFADEWTFHLLFTDQKLVVTHHFNLAEAKAIVERILAKATDPNKKPESCQYCQWCAKKSTCVEVVGPVTETQALVASEVSIDTIKAELLADPARLGAFLKKANIFKKELWDWAKDEAKRQIEAGNAVDGFRLVKVKDSETFPIAVVAEAAQATQATYLEIAKLIGDDIKGDALREWAEPRGYFPQADQAIYTKNNARLTESKK
jgi:uncharacterized protein YdbL (DUF1318 family)